jgi:hypothetical protein
MKLHAIDPGPERSAVVTLDTSIGGARPYVQLAAEMSTDELLAYLRAHAFPEHRLAIEQIASMGMIVGAEVFETAYVSGRFVQTWLDARGGRISRIPRVHVKHYLCGTHRAKDKNIRQALIDHYGGKDKAIGNKRAPGALYDVSGHTWSALAVAITHLGTLETV